MVSDHDGDGHVGGGQGAEDAANTEMRGTQFGRKAADWWGLLHKLYLIKVEVQALRLTEN